MSLPAQAERSRAFTDRVRAGTIVLLDHPQLLTQLRNAVVMERGTQFVISARDKRRQKDDLLDCLLLACDSERFGKMVATLSATDDDRRANWSRGIFTTQEAIDGTMERYLRENPLF